MLMIYRTSCAKMSAKTIGFAALQRNKSYEGKQGLTGLPRLPGLMINQVNGVYR